MASSIQPLCIHCVSGDVIPGEPKGTIETIGPYETYVSKPPAESASAASEGKAVVLFTDVFGLALQNNKIVADLIAERSSITVYVPDVRGGGRGEGESWQHGCTLADGPAESPLHPPPFSSSTVRPWRQRG